MISSATPTTELRQAFALWKLWLLAAALFVLPGISEGQKGPTPTPTRTATPTVTPTTTATPTPTPMLPQVRQSASGWTAVVLIPPGTNQGRRLDPAAFLAEYAHLFGIVGGELKLLAQESDALGQTHLRYVQQKNGVPLIGAEVRLHVDAGGAVAMGSGRGADITDAVTSPALSAPLALERERQAWASRYAVLPKRELPPQLFLFSSEMVRQRPAGEAPRLVWQCTAANDSGTAAHSYLIDAQTGDLLLELEAVRSDMLRRVKDCGASDRRCHLDEAVLLAGQTAILGRSEGQPARLPHPQFSEKLGENESNIAYDSLGYAYSYYQDTFGRNGCNDQGGMGDGQAWQANETAAYTYVDFWGAAEEMECPNAGFSDITPSLIFCQGVMSVDLVGHEYTHGVFHYALRDGYGQPSGFVYFGESGAIDEGLADIFGAAIQRFYTHDESDWNLFEDSSFGILRSMSDPTLYNSGFGLMPDHFYSANLYCGQEDSAGVHHNSGIVAKLAYLVAAGGTFNGCTIAPLGRDKQEAIFYRAFRYYLASNSGFNDLAQTLPTACGELYSSEDCKQLLKAISAVEIDQPGLCRDPRHFPAGEMCASIDDPTHPAPVPVDIQAPLLRVAAPKNGKLVRRAQLIRFSDNEIAAPQCSLDRRRWVPCISGQTRIRDLPRAARLKAGQRFSLYVRDVDANGNVGMAVVRRLKLIGSQRRVLR
jgi:bacillolysin